MLMNRYCNNCQKNYDIPGIKSMKDLDNIVCPMCGQKIESNSRKPQPASGFSDAELHWAKIIQTLFNMSYLFYLTMAVIGIEGYIFHHDLLLYIATGIAVAMYILQVYTRTATFRWGMLLLPLGALAGGFYFRTPQGACLGICIVFAVRHLLRDVFWKLLGRFIEFANRQK